jgi:hypothetical protein
MKHIHKIIYKNIHKNIEVIIFLILSVCLAVYIGYRYMEKFENDDKPYGINQVNGIVYINLENRSDRKELLLKELEELKTDMSKVNKISGVYIPKNGHKGCVQAHILALNLSKLNKWDKTLILEDDAQLNVLPDDFNKIINLLFEKIKDKPWDVIMLAGANKVYDDNVHPIPFTIESVQKDDKNQDITINKSLNIKKLKSATTSSAYIIKNTYLDTLLNLFNTCNNQMEHIKLSGNNYEQHALDQKWSKLQEKDNWYCIDEDPIRQRAIWSTIMKESHQ